MTRLKKPAHAPLGTIEPIEKPREDLGDSGFLRLHQHSHGKRKEKETMIKQAITKVVRGEDLRSREMKSAMEEILDNLATPAQIGAFLAALRIKGETVTEITAAARALRSRAAKVIVGDGHVNIDRDEINVERETVLDTCGTGGDEARTLFLPGIRQDGIVSLFSRARLG